MAPFYEHMCTHYPSFVLDEKHLAELKKANEADLKVLEDKITDATENLGETEVRDAVQDKAAFFANIGDEVSKSSASFRFKFSYH